MKISGFTIIKNAQINGYPVVESIKSILPVVNEMIVLIGDSEDDTVAMIAAIGSAKIKIHHSVWDLTQRTGGVVLAKETDKAFQLIDPAADWAFYIQADEVLHEKYHAAILAACELHKTNLKVEGLLFEYLHFYGTYDYVGDSRRWYDHEVRIIRNDKRITAFRDAQGFRIGKEKLWVKNANSTIYHYGWVKSPASMKQKQKHVSRYWNEDAALTNEVAAEEVFDFDDFDSLVLFKEAHPAVMENLVKNQHWNIALDISKKRFSLTDRFLYWFEKKTGIRPFDFRNYRKLP